ncbi:hypothetical protein [Aliarcobacter butzleri]
MVEGHVNYSAIKKRVS